MEAVSITCDTCFKKMGVMLVPDDYDAETLKGILDGLSVSWQCELCDITKKK